MDCLMMYIKSSNFKRWKGEYRISMDTKEKLKLLEEVMDTEKELTPAMELAEINEWDSTTGVAFIIMLDATFGKTVLGGELRACRTVQDLLNLMAE